MDERTLRARLASWANLGPLRSIEDLQREIDRDASLAGPAAAPLLASALAALEREGSPLLDPMLELLNAYVTLFPEALAAALIDELRPDGPPNVIEVLGSTRSSAAVKALRARVALDEAGEDTLVAVACALGDIGGPEAIGMLKELLSRSSLPDPARREVEIALRASA